MIRPLRGVPLVLGLLALLLTVQVHSAAAGLTWCRVDPIVTLNGTSVQILVAIPDEDQALVDGPITVTVKTPRAVVQELVFTDAGFNGYGEQVRFGDLWGRIASDGSFPIQIQVTVPAGGRRDLPMRVELVPANGETIAVEGTNGGLTIRTRLVGS